jgi:hypothetical protein
VLGTVHARRLRPVLCGPQQEPEDSDRIGEHELQLEVAHIRPHVVQAVQRVEERDSRVHALLQILPVRPIVDVAADVQQARLTRRPAVVVVVRIMAPGHDIVVRSEAVQHVRGELAQRNRAVPHPAGRCREDHLHRLVEHRNEIRVEIREHEVDVRPRVRRIVEIDGRVLRVEVDAREDTIVLFTIMSRAGSSVTKPGRAKSIFGRPAKMSRYESDRLTRRRPSERSKAARLSNAVELRAPATTSLMRASSSACAPASMLVDSSNLGISVAARRNVSEMDADFSSESAMVLRAIALASVSPTSAELVLNLSYCRRA